jgi:hypothetical protein
MKMTKEARKFAFKKATTCGPTTIILTAIIMYFSMAKAYAANPTTLAGTGIALGGTVTITSLICCFLQYLIVGGEFKKQFTEGGQKLPDMGPREVQVVFPTWVPAKWWAYVIFVSVFAGIVFGTGIPCYLASWGVNPGGIGRVWYAILSGVINGCGTWYAVYLTQIYLIQFFNEKAAAAAKSVQ